jgi:hypothetical protein
MNSWEEENKCISTRWFGDTIGWLHRFILCFFGNKERGIRAEMASTGWTDAIIVSSDAQKVLKCSGFYTEYCREFHKLSNKYKIAQNGVWSRELWPNYRRAATWVTGWTFGTVGATSILRCSKLVKYSGFFQNLVQNFINFTTSISSSKTEFGAKRYGRNTEGHMAAHDDPMLHKMTPSVHSTVYLN